MQWWNTTGRKPYLNYCIDGTNNNLQEHKQSCKIILSPLVFNFTFSVVCSANENMKSAGYKNLISIRKF